MDDFFYHVIPNDMACDFVIKYHYSHRAPAAPKFSFGICESGGIFGNFGKLRTAIIYSHPVNRNYNPKILELIRLVRDDDYNKPLSSFVSWTLRWLKKNTDVPYVISYADSQFGHHGGIYQACSFYYVGIRKESCVGFQDKEGNFIHRRSAYAKFGTSSKDKLKDEELEPIEGMDKFLYVKPIRWKPKRIFAELKAEPLPYPKPDKEKTE